jgi:hypothetical protein
MISAVNGTTNANILFEKNAPPNKAIAAMGEKFGKCGNNLLSEATAIRIQMVIIFLFMFL